MACIEARSVDPSIFEHPGGRRGVRTTIVVKYQFPARGG